MRVKARKKVFLAITTLLSMVASIFCDGTKEVSLLVIATFFSLEYNHIVLLEKIEELKNEK